MSGAKRRILVLRYRFIGDTILTVPFLRNLRRAEPEAFIAWMVAPGSADIVAGIPYVDELIYWDPVTIHADSTGAHRTLSAKLAFVRDLRRRRFEKVYVLKRSLSSAGMAWLSGARERVGFDTEARGCLLTKRVAYRNDQHEVQNFLDVLRADGVPVVDDFLELWIRPDEEARTTRLLANAGIHASDRIAVLHPFSAVVQRGWPFENFKELADLLARETGSKIAIVGGPKDVAAGKDSVLSSAQGVVSLVGALSLRETAALLKRAALFVGNDSGIMHVAAAAGTPVVALFGPQSPVKFGPWTKRRKVMYKAFPCSPCRQKFFTECSPSARMRPSCMESITVAEVLGACRELLADHAAL